MEAGIGTTRGCTTRDLVRYFLWPEPALLLVAGLAGVVLRGIG
jgi:hypothetical protein